MARQLRQIPESQEFTDRESLPGWRVTTRMGRAPNGAWVIASLSIEPDGRTTAAMLRRAVPGHGITTRMLRQITLRGAAQYGAAVLRADSLTPNPPTRRATPRRGRPPAYSTAHYLRVAARYRALLAADVHEVSRELAREFGLSRAAMRSQVSRCRARGLLPPTVQGRASA